MSVPGSPGHIRSGAFSPEATIADQLMRAYARGEVPLQDVIAALDNRNVPPQLKQTPFSVTIAETDPPKLLIPENRTAWGG